MATDSGLFHRLYLIASTYQHEGCDFAEQLRQGQNGPAFFFELPESMILLVSYRFLLHSKL